MHILKGVCLESVQSLDDCLIQRQAQALKDFFFRVNQNITNSGIERLFVQSQSVKSKQSLKPDCVGSLKILQTVCLKAIQAMCLEAMYVLEKSNSKFNSVIERLCRLEKNKALGVLFLESMILVKEIKLVKNFNSCVIYRQCKN